MDYPQAAWLGFAMPDFKQPQAYRNDANRFRATARKAKGALKRDLEELAELYDSLADHLEQLESQPPSTRRVLN
jgi:hypothetical protein